MIFCGFAVGSMMGNHRNAWRRRRCLAWTEVVDATPPFSLHTSLTDGAAVMGPTAGTYNGDAARGCAHGGWNYSADANGRILQGRGPVILPMMQRPRIARGSLCAEWPLDLVLNKKTDDDAGHIRARCLGGRFGIVNFVPQLSANNQGIQCGIETMLRSLVQDGGCTIDNITVAYTYPACPNTNVALPSGFFRPTTVRYQAAPDAVCTNAGWNMTGTAIDISFPN